MQTDAKLCKAMQGYAINGNRNRNVNGNINGNGNIILMPIKNKLKNTNTLLMLIRIKIQITIPMRFKREKKCLFFVCFEQKFLPNCEFLWEGTILTLHFRYDKIVLGCGKAVTCACVFRGAKNLKLYCKKGDFAL